jgi:hypothetical protein
MEVLETTMDFLGKQRKSSSEKRELCRGRKGTIQKAKEPARTGSFATRITYTFLLIV